MPNVMISDVSIDSPPHEERLELTRGRIMLRMIVFTAGFCGRSSANDSSTEDVPLVFNCRCKSAVEITGWTGNSCT